MVRNVIILAYTEKPKESDKLLTLEMVCEWLDIKKYLTTLVKNDIDVEDLFMLTEKDLHNMKFSIGAKNRVMLFQRAFKNRSQKEIVNDLKAK